MFTGLVELNALCEWHPQYHYNRMLMKRMLRLSPLLLPAPLSMLSICADQPQLGVLLLLLIRPMFSRALPTQTRPHVTITDYSTVVKCQESTTYQSSSAARKNTEANVGALIIRIGFWGPLYYNYNKEPSQNSIDNYLRPPILLHQGGT